MFLMPIAPLARTQPRHVNGAARDLSRAFDRLFDETFAERSSTRTAHTPPVDLQESDAAYLLQVNLPGVARDDVKITIDGKQVRIEAEARSNPDAPADATASAADQPAAAAPRVLVRERRAAAYARSLSLPVEIDEAASQAKLEHGVLHLTLAKKTKPATQLTVN